MTDLELMSRDNTQMRAVIDWMMNEILVLRTANNALKDSNTELLRKLPPEAWVRSSTKNKEDAA